MSSTNIRNSSESENVCVVCFKNFEIFSIGVCDHPVCYECSTRMRVLCRQNECPICRQNMPKVIFSKYTDPYFSLRPKVERSNFQDRKFGVYFFTPSIQRAYYRLLEHECGICKRSGHGYPFKTFQQLKDHMRREHELFYCDLCVANLKIFTFERKCYSRSELGTHRRKGDTDNTSHRGHPICEFCDTRFMDNDELFRHLRRDHLYCHFCDADGKHQYYNTYDDLRKHYSEEHYLCEEGDCVYEQFTSVFRSDIDLKAHVASVHSRHMSKAATKQARTLELEFTLAPRSRPEVNIRGRRPFGARHTDNPFEDEGAVGFNLEPGGMDPFRDNGPEQNKVFVNPLSAENFPSLSGDCNGPRTVSNVTITSSKLNPFSAENFPTLGGNNAAPPRSSAVTITTSSKFNSKSKQDFPTFRGASAAPRQQPGVTITRTVRGQQGLERNLENFPVLGGDMGSSNTGTSTLSFSVNSNIQERPQSAKTPNVSIHVNHKCNGAITTRISQTPTSQTISVRPKSSDFPALSSAPVPQLQWVSQKSKKQQEPKVNKVAPAPSLPPSGLNDFPTLSKGGKNDQKARKSTTVTVPVSNMWVNLNNFNSDSKNSKENLRNSDNNSAGDITAKENKQRPEKKEKINSKNTKVGDGKGSKNAPKESTSNFKTNENKNEPKPNFWETSESKNNKNKKKKSKNGGNVESGDDSSSTSNKTNSVGNKNDLNESNRSENKNSKSYAMQDTKILSQSQNGIVKKRSELNIGALEISEPLTVSMNYEEFPDLGYPKPPPGFAVKPPPGFNTFTNSFENVTNPSISEVNSLSNDLTFTSSSGQSYSILPTQQYHPPPNFTARNRILIERFMTVLRDKEAIHQFKLYSDMFRNGSIPAVKYYEHCQGVMKSEFEKIFPELLVLLPDVQKQQELYKAHIGTGSKKGLEVCATCKQIVSTNDLRNHLSNHTLDNHFPILSKPEEVTNVWNKK